MPIQQETLDKPGLRRDKVMSYRAKALPCVGFCKRLKRMGCGARPRMTTNQRRARGRSGRRTNKTFSDRFKTEFAVNR